MKVNVNICNQNYCSRRTLQLHCAAISAKGVFCYTSVDLLQDLRKKELKRKLMFWKNLARLGSSCIICVKVMHCSLPLVAPPGGGGGVGPLLTPLGASFLPLN